MDNAELARRIESGEYSEEEILHLADIYGIGENGTPNQRRRRLIQRLQGAEHRDNPAQVVQETEEEEEEMVDQRPNDNQQDGVLTDADFTRLGQAFVPRQEFDQNLEETNNRLGNAEEWIGTLQTASEETIRSQEEMQGAMTTISNNLATATEQIANLGERVTEVRDEVVEHADEGDAQINERISRQVGLVKNSVFYGIATAVIITTCFVILALADVGWSGSTAWWIVFGSIFAISVGVGVAAVAALIMSLNRQDTVEEENE